MAVTLGTDVYWEIADIDSYWTDRGNTDWTGDTTANKEVNARKATDWIDRNFKFVGDKLVATQRLQWPRTNATDNDGNDVSSGVALYPWQVQEATAIVADLYRQGTYDLEGILTSKKSSVTREKVDVIETAYDSSKRLQSGDVPSHVYQLLTVLTTQNKLLRA